MSTSNNGKEAQTINKIIIFGSTGTIGQQIVRQALEQGYAVTAFARTPAKVAFTHENLTIVQGDVLDPPTPCSLRMASCSSTI